MANISLDDLYPSEIESLLDTERKEGGLIKTSVNRALELRGAASYNRDPHTMGMWPVADKGSAVDLKFS